MKKKHVLLPLLSPPTPQRSSRYLLITLNYLFIVQAVALSSIYEPLPVLSRDKPRNNDQKFVAYQFVSALPANNVIGRPRGIT